MPTCPRDLHRVAQQFIHIKQFQFRLQRLARKGLNAPNRRCRILRRGDDNAETTNQFFIVYATKNELRPAQNRRQRIIEIVSDAGSELAQCSQFVGASGALMFLFLLRNIVRDPQDTGRLPIDDNRRAVHHCVTNAAVSRQVT